MSDDSRDSTSDQGVDRSLAGSIVIRLAALALIGLVVSWFKVILVPIVFAGLLSFLVKPLIDWLTEKRMPFTPAIILSELVATLPLLGLAFIFLATAGPLSQQLPKYQEQLTLRVDQGIDGVLNQIGLQNQRKVLKKEIAQNLVPNVLEQGAEVVKTMLSTATNALGSFLLTLILSGFMLNEARRFREKFAQAFGHKHPWIGVLDGIGSDVRRYVVAKTLISGLTGFVVWAFLELCGVDFAAFWGLLAFPLNFIPTLGAVIASLPPILQSLIDPMHTPMTTTVVLVGLFLINGFIGSVIDPRYVGQAVKLSPLIVFFSMLVWGVLWGPVGMILAVPIMVSVKFILSRIPSCAAYATLMEG